MLGAIVVTRANEETGERPDDQAEEKQHGLILGCGPSQIRVFDPHAIRWRLWSRLARRYLREPRWPYGPDHMSHPALVEMTSSSR